MLNPSRPHRILRPQCSLCKASSTPQKAATYAHCGVPARRHLRSCAAAAAAATPPPQLRPGSLPMP